MAPLAVPNGDGILALHHLIGGYSRELVCTIGVGIDEGEPFTQAAVNGIFDNWKTNMASSLTVNLTFLKAVFYWKQPLGYVPFVSNTATATGGSSGTSTTPNTAIMVEKTTGRPGRAGRGRMYVPGLSELAITPAGLIDATFMTDLTTSLDAFYDFMTDESGIFDDLLLFHQTNNVDTTPTVIDALVPNGRVSAIGKRFRRS